MTPYALAKASGLAFGTVYRMCRKDGRFGRIEAKTLDKICAVLDCEPGDLFERVP
jgi:DNA-binding Xre family transcriptional regulator